MKTECSSLRKWSESGRLFLGVLAGLGLAFTPLAQAASLSFNPVDDNMILKHVPYSSNTYLNFSGGTLLGASIYGGATSIGEYSLLRFHISDLLPPDAVITGVTLSLTAAYGYSYSNGEVLRFAQVNPTNAGWEPGAPENATAGATGAYLNQTSYTDPTTHAGTPWASGGIFNASTGDLGAEVGSRTFTSIAANTTYTFDLDVSLVNGWLLDSNAENAGLAFYMTNTESIPDGSRFMYFYSMDAAVGTAFLPLLTINYEVIPEPSALAGIAMGGLLLAGIHRKRRYA